MVQFDYGEMNNGCKAFKTECGMSAESQNFEASRDSRCYETAL
jgi:hypothetical protein